LHRCGPGISIQPCPTSPPFPPSPTSRLDERSRSRLKPVPSLVRPSKSIFGMFLQRLGNTTRPLKWRPRVPTGLSGVGVHARHERQGEDRPRQITFIVARIVIAKNRLPASISVHPHRTRSGQGTFPNLQGRRLALEGPRADRALLRYLAASRSLPRATSRLTPASRTEHNRNTRCVPPFPARSDG
jgi:hypothetical protein